MVSFYTYADRSKHSTKYAEERRHGPHYLAPSSCRRGVRVESLLTIRYDFRQGYIHLRLRWLLICPNRYLMRSAVGLS